MMRKTEATGNTGCKYGCYLEVIGYYIRAVFVSKLSRCHVGRTLLHIVMFSILLSVCGVLLRRYHPLGF